MSTDLQTTIDKAWDDRDAIGFSTKGEVRDAVETALLALDSGERRVAERDPTGGSSTSGSKRRCCSPSASTTWS
jgi:2,3,4,5-tetrahydropyridine-2-carboxylate N-succinyltransferase